MPITTAHIFPAFVLKYTGKETGILEKYKYDLASKIKECEELLGININNFHPKGNNYINDELKNQALSFVFATAFSDIIKKHQPLPNYISGFSMGIYSALYHANAISFKDGLILINEVFKLIKQIMGQQSYRMASVIGFSKDELLNLITKFNTLELVIQNGEFSFVLAGNEIELKKAFQVFETKGAIHLSLFPVNFPYHSQALKPYQKDFQSLVEKVLIKNADIPIISMITQETLFNANDLKTELVNNIIQPLNFYQTIKVMVDKGVNEFIEVGADACLLKSSKFIDGNFDFKAVAKGRVI